MFVCFLFLQQNRIFLWCQHLICIFCAWSLWAALGRNSLMVLNMLFYHCNIKCLTFQYNNSMLAVWGSILAAAFWWHGCCGVLVSQTELLPVDLYCFDILGVAFLFLTWLYSTMSVYIIDSLLFSATLQYLGIYWIAVKHSGFVPAVLVPGIPGATFGRREWRTELCEWDQLSWSASALCDHPSI